MAFPRIANLLHRLIRNSAQGHGFLWICFGLSLGGTLGALYPITAVVVPAAMLVPGRWRQITVTTALGSALGATALVMAFHQLGWVQLYDRFPELATQATWHRIIEWVANFGSFALFAIAASPLPQTPALIFFGIARHDYQSVFLAMLSGKIIKYGLLAWLAARFPERFSRGFGGFPRYRPPGKRNPGSS